MHMYFRHFNFVIFVVFVTIVTLSIKMDLVNLFVISYILVSTILNCIVIFPNLNEYKKIKNAANLPSIPLNLFNKPSNHLLYVFNLITYVFSHGKFF